MILPRPGISGYSDVRTLSHEVAEWLNDPFVNNAVPGWSANEECGNDLEVADPLDAPAGSGVQVDGYDLQDTAFFSWFARQSRSVGIRQVHPLRHSRSHRTATGVLRQLLAPPTLWDPGGGAVMIACP